MKLSNIELIKSLYKFTKPFRKTLLIIFSLILTMTAIDALNTLFLSKIFDAIGGHGTQTQALIFTALAGLMVLIKIVLNRWRNIVEIEKLDVFVTNHLNHESIAKFFTFSNGQHINEHSGVKQNIITSGFNSIQNQMHWFIYNFIPSITQFVVAIVVLFWINFYIGLAYFGLSIAFVWSIYKLNKYLDPKIKEIRDIRNSNSRLLSEIFRFVFLIKNEVAENKSLNYLDESQQKHQDAYVKNWSKAIEIFTLIHLITQIFRYITLFVAVILLFNGMVTAGSIFLIFTWSANYINSLWNLTEMQKQFINDKANIEKYFELLNIKPDIIVKENAYTKNLIGDIKFSKVEFSYLKRVSAHSDEVPEQSEPILKSISFNIEKGQKVAFVGESGSGKSTIANLIRRSFDPQSGKITTNGLDLKDIELSLFLKMIGSVDQEVILFDRSIRENISFGLDRLLTDDELESISKKSGVHKFYHKLECGWDTIIGERGCKLSGGEKQRIGIARALAKNPEILIFDEATSALDTISESEVQSAIDESCSGKTAIIIAHRLSTVKNCDKIFVMSLGQIVAEGTHDELLETSDYYVELVKNQLNESQIV